jgi:hypothetical protein
MNYLTKSVRTLGQMVSVVLGGGFSTPTDDTLRDHLHFGFDR